MQLVFHSLLVTLGQRPSSLRTMAAALLKQCKGCCQLCVVQTVALIFDDAPDENGNTDKVLDALKAAGVKATFYVNGNNYCNASAPPCSTTLARIKAEGHDIGGRTFNHPHTDTLTDAKIATEFSALNSLVGHSMTVCFYLCNLLLALCVSGVTTAACSATFCSTCNRAHCHAQACDMHACMLILTPYTQQGNDN